MGSTFKDSFGAAEKAEANCQRLNPSQVPNTVGSNQRGLLLFAWKCGSGSGGEERGEGEGLGWLILLLYLGSTSKPDHVVLLGGL